MDYLVGRNCLHSPCEGGEEGKGAREKSPGTHRASRTSLLLRDPKKRGTKGLLREKERVASSEKGDYQVSCLELSYAASGEMRREERTENDISGPEKKGKVPTGVRMQ